LRRNVAVSAGYRIGTVGRFAFGSETRCGGVVVEAFPGSAVEFLHDMGDVLSTVEGEVGALGEVLANKPVEILVRSPLPRAGAFGEEDRDAGRFGESFMAGHFNALVPGQGTLQMPWQGRKRCRDGGVDTSSGAVGREVDDDAVLSLPLSEGDHR